MKSLLLVAMICMAPLSRAETKLGVVDMRRALTQTKDGQRAEKNLAEEFNKRRAQLEAMQTKMRKLSEDFERQAAALSANSRNKRKTLIASEAQRFQQAVARQQSEMAELQQKILQPIATRLNTVVATLAKKEQLTLVLDRQAEVLYVEPAADLTEKVIAEYDRIARAD